MTTTSPEMAALRCELCGRDGSDGYLCVRCASATVVRLQELPALYRALAAFLRPGPAGPGGPVTKSVTKSGLPVAEAPLNLRGPGGMTGVVEDWLDAVVGERHLPVPVREGALELRLERAAVGLLGHMGWIAVSWPAAGDFATEIRSLVRAAMTIVDPQDLRSRGTRLGLCPALTPVGSVCGAVLRHFPGEKTLKCAWCGCTYPPAMWAGLKQLIDEDEKGWELVPTPGGHGGAPVRTPGGEGCHG